MEITTSNVKFTTYPSTEWITDKESGGIGEKETSLDVVAQDIYFILSTERYKYPIMGSNFGVMLADLVGADYAYIQSEIVRRVKDALSVDDRIKEITDFSFTKDDTAGSLVVEFTVQTTYGSINEVLTVST